MMTKVVWSPEIDDSEYFELEDHAAMLGFPAKEDACVTTLQVPHYCHWPL